MSCRQFYDYLANLKFREIKSFKEKHYAYVHNLNFGYY